MSPHWSGTGILIVRQELKRSAILEEDEMAKRINVLSFRCEQKVSKSGGFS
jgi:hypothetical protein